MRREMILAKREVYSIRLHKLLARLLLGFEHIGLAGKNIIFLFSRRAQALELMRTGEIFEMQGETEEALEYFEKALNRCPRLYDVNLNLCRCYLRLLSVNKAKEHGLRFLKHNPDNSEINLYIGVIYYYENKISEALASLKKAEELMPSKDKKRASALEYIAECYMKHGEHKEAVRHFEESIAMYPRSTGEKRFVSLGEGYYLLNKKEEALQSFKKALELNPDNYEAWNNIGVLMWSVNKLEDAYKYFKKALDIKPDYKEARTNIDEMRESIKSVKGYARNKVNY